MVSKVQRLAQELTDKLIKYKCSGIEEFLPYMTSFKQKEDNMCVEVSALIGFENLFSLFVKDIYFANLVNELIDDYNDGSYRRYQQVWIDLETEAKNYGFEDILFNIYELIDYYSRGYEQKIPFMILVQRHELKINIIYSALSGIENGLKNNDKEKENKVASKRL